MDDNAAPDHPAAGHSPVAAAAPLGGQAVVGGVMLRRGSDWCVAVRRPDGSIATRTGVVPPSRLPAWPGLRGLSSLASGLALGTRALVWSGEMQLPDGRGRRDGRGAIAAAAVVPVLFFGLAFMALPAAAAGVVADGWARAGLEGVLRAVMVLGYVWGIGRIPSIAEVFGYHGAEHKVVNCVEDGAETSLSFARAYPTYHPRCGTSFLVVVVAVATVVFALAPGEGLVGHVLSRFVGLPIVAALAYEVLGILSRTRSRLGTALARPGRWVQSLTTVEPRDDQLEVALVAAAGVGVEVADLPVAERSVTTAV